MPVYRFLNEAKTLVQRGDTVIAWDPRTKMPSATQVKQLHSATDKEPTSIDETARWKEAGSPVPDDYVATDHRAEPEKS